MAATVRSAIPTTAGQPGRRQSSFSSLAARTYSVAVKDGSGCTASVSVTVTQPQTKVTIVSTPVTDVRCRGAATGIIRVNATCGTGALHYSIDNGATFQSGNQFSGLSARTYTLVVKDDNDCTETATATVQEPATAVTIAQIHVDPVLCRGDATGSIKIDASGGTGALSYSIDGGKTFQGTDTFNDLRAGDYPIVVKDANECAKTGQCLRLRTSDGRGDSRSGNGREMFRRGQRSHYRDGDRRDGRA